MPKNNNLEPVKLPMDLKFGKCPKTRFENNLTAIHVDLVKGPTLNEIKEWIPYFVDATWTEHPCQKLDEASKDKYISELFKGLCLPTARETITFVLRIRGISLQEVTHILRHRLCSFSADCSGDKWWSEKDCLVPESIQNSPEFYERYKKIVEESKQLYCDMIDSKEISIMDARSILTRNLETFYYMKIDLGNMVAFINQRKDVQIQPQTDNILAYEFTKILCNLYGNYVADLVSFANPSPFYQKMARTGKATNLYFPEPEVDNFDWNENDFIYQCRREEMNGTNPTDEKSIFTKLQIYYFDIFNKYGIKLPYWYYERKEK